MVEIVSNTKGSNAKTAYQETIQVLISLAVIYCIKKLKSRYASTQVMALIFVSNIMIVFKFYFD